MTIRETHDLRFLAGLIEAARTARDTGEAQRAGMVYGCAVMVLAPDQQPPVEFMGRLALRFDATGGIA